MIWLVLLSGAFIAYELAEIILSRILKGRLRIRERLAEVEKIGSQKQKKRGAPSTLSARLNFLQISDNVRRDIQLSGLNIKPEEFVVLWFFIVLIPTVLCFTFTLDFLRVVAVMLIGLLLPPVYVRGKVRSQRALFQQQFGDALMIISNALRSGSSFQNALDHVAMEMPDPLGREFATAVREIKLGVNVEEALDNVAQRMQSEDLKLMATAVVVQQQVGGNLAQIMDTISKTIRDRLSVARMIQTLTAQGRLSGMIVGALPIGLLVVLSLLSPGYFDPLFSSLFGRMLLGLGAIMELLGFFCIRKLIDIRL